MSGKSLSLLAGLVALVGTVQVALLYPQIAHGGVIREEFMWLPSLGLNFVLRMDGFAWLFSMLVLGIGVGGCFDKVAYLAKKALLRPVDSHNAEPFWAELDDELIEKKGRYYELYIL